MRWQPQLFSVSIKGVLIRESRVLLLRNERGEWRDVPDVYRDGDSFELPGLTRAVAVAEVYDGLLDAAGRSLLR